MRKFTLTKEAQTAAEFDYGSYERFECECCGDDAFFDFEIEPYAMAATHYETNDWEDYFREEEEQLWRLEVLFEEFKSEDDVKSLTDKEKTEQIIPLLTQVSHMTPTPMKFKGVKLES